MSTSSSVYLSMIDDYSKQLNSMSNANTGFSKTMEEIQKAAKQQNNVLKANQEKLASLRTELQKASKIRKTGGPKKHQYSFPVRLQRWERMS